MAYWNSSLIALVNFARPTGWDFPGGTYRMMWQNVNVYLWNTISIQFVFYFSMFSHKFSSFMGIRLSSYHPVSQIR